MRLEKIVWYDRHHVLLSFDKFSYALSRFPRSIKIPTLYQDCLCETSEAWKNFKQFKIFSRSPRPSRFTHALLRSSRFDHTTPYDPPAFLKRGERGKRDPSVNLALWVVTYFLQMSASNVTLVRYTRLPGLLGFVCSALAICRINF